MRSLSLALFLCLFFSVLSPTSARAAGGVALNTQVNHMSVDDTGSKLWLDGIALNAAAADDRTIEVELGGIWAKLEVDVYFTRSTATDVTAVFTCSKDGTRYTRKTSSATALGVRTFYLRTGVFPTVVSVDFTLEYDVRACQSIKIVFGGTASGAGDLVDVEVTAEVGI